MKLAQKCLFRLKHKPWVFSRYDGWSSCSVNFTSYASVFFFDDR